MNIFKNISITYRTIRYRKKLAKQNMNDLIRENFESACSFYRGFFGEPTVDCDLYTAYKSTQMKSAMEINDCMDAVKQKGWDLICTKTNDGSYMKIIMVPGYDIKNYLTQKSMGKEHPETVALYKRLGGNVI